MKKLMATLGVTTALTLPALASAQTVTLHTQMRNYWGNPAYLAYYLTDPQGRYVRTLWLAYGERRYWPHLIDWYRATGGSPSAVAGVTGASVGSGRSLNVSVDLKQSLIDAGYQIRIDAAVEGMPESPNDVIVPLSSKNAGKPVAGRGYIQSFSFSM
ncbi:DUF2271 domain-containing protein [Thioclava atlantica]|uniref:Tat pathway signal protein n=1 Tax=Thioclava atlantica TaxID=1317124 RepID=A0A085TWM2_9RHOB|nr:DUF2271 domain-containing protein [Thioclava atlantica]KFE35119.1 hypothetical protein DW2_09096 [Thioclava atlantica]